MDVEDEESTPVTSTPDNGNMPVNPLIEQPSSFMNNQLNGVGILLNFTYYSFVGLNKLATLYVSLYIYLSLLPKSILIMTY